MINVHIMMGLPASGKTTLAHELARKYVNKGIERKIIDLDYYKDYTLEDAIRKGISPQHLGYCDCAVVILDGLLLTNKDLVTTINVLKEFDYYNRNVKIEDFNITIHYFKEDREACLHNDYGRRNETAAITIENALFEKPDQQYIKEQTGLGCTIKNHIIHKKSDFDMFRDLHKLGRLDSLTSDSWSLGGTYGTCWDNTLTPISPENPLEFDEFDKLLERICPDITFLHYQKLKKECCEVKNYEENDYYGGTEYRANHICHLPKLYELLNEMGYINLQENDTLNKQQFPQI